MNVTIREAQGSDVPSLGILRGQSIETACSDVYDRTAFADLVTDAREAVAEWVDDTETTVLLAETTVTPVGYVAFDADSGRLWSICTSPDHQHEGVATALLRRVESRARAAGTAELLATVPDVAREFFAARGFSADRPAQWHGLDATTMRKSLEE